MEEKNIETMEISGRTLKELWIAAKWAKLLAIITVVTYFIMILLSIFSGIIFTLFASMIPFGGFFLTITYILVYSLSMLIPGILLYNFASHTQQAILKNDDDLATNGFKRLRQLFQYSGILTISVVILLVVAIIVLVAASTF